MSDAMTTAFPSTDHRLSAEAIEPRETALQTVYVVLPAYNEQEALGALLEAIRSALDDAPWPYKVIVVDDGSQDATTLVASKATFVMPVELVEHRFNQGLAA